jgi:hypothetical protein
MHLFQLPSKLGRQSCRDAYLLMCVSGSCMRGRLYGDWHRIDTINWKGLYLLAVVFLARPPPSPCIYHSTFFPDDSKKVLHSYLQAGWQVDREDLWERNSPDSALGGKSQKNQLNHTYTLVLIIFLLATARSWSAELIQHSTYGGSIVQIRDVGACGM